MTNEQLLEAYQTGLPTHVAGLRMVAEAALAEEAKQFEDIINNPPPLKAADKAVLDEIGPRPFRDLRKFRAKEKRLELAKSYIMEYLGNGGLFNPEMMEHDKVRNLLMDILDIIRDEHGNPRLIK